METIYVQYPTPRASFNRKVHPRYDLSILTEENNGHYNDELELHSNQPLVAPQPRKLVCPSPSGPPPQNFFKFDSTDLKDSKARQAEDEIMGIFFRDFDSSSGIEIVSDSLVSESNSQTEPSQAFIKRLTSSPCPIPPRDFTTPIPVSNSRRPSIASNRLASPFPMGTPPGRVACLPFNSSFIDNNPIGAEFGLLSLSPPAGNKDDVLLQHQRVNAVMNRQRSLSLGDNPRAALLGKA